MAFVAVVRAGSFTEAGRRLGIPKSTLSRQVSRLESHLGARLLQRTTRRLSLTETGEAYFARCRSAIEEIEDAERVALDVAGRPTGTVRVSTPFDLARDRLAPLIPEFMRRYPEVQLSFFMTQRRIDMVEEGFDVALRGGTMPDSGLIARKIAETEMLLCASPEYLAAHGRPTTVQELADHDGVLMGSNGTSILSLPWRGPDGVVSLQLRERLLGNEWGFLHEAIRSGLGIGALMLVDVVDDLEAGRLERVLPELALRGGGLFAVYPSRHHLTPKVRVFVDYLVEKLENALLPVRPS